MMDTKGKFDYAEAVSELERIASRVEDPATGLDDIDRYISRVQELMASCRSYLRQAREKVDGLDADSASGK